MTSQRNEMLEHQTGSKGNANPDQRVAKKLRGEIEERLRLTINKIVDGYFETDLEGNFTFFNDAICRQIIGYSKEETMRMNYRRYTDKASAKKVFREFHKVYQTGEPSKPFAWKIIRKDGTRIYVESSAMLLKDVSGSPIGFRGVVYDITERKQAEEAMLQSEEKYRSILENIREAYFEVDLAGNFTFFNDSLCRMTGCSKKELIGAKYTRFSDEENSKSVFKKFNKIFKTGKPAEAFDWRIIKANGDQAHVEASILLRKDSAGCPIGFKGVLRDITERKHAEAELQQARDKLHDAEKLSALGQLSIVVAHEILNPLNIIFMELQILQAMESMPSEAQEELNICILQIDRIVNIAEELKQLTSSPEQKMEMADINDLIARVLTIYKSQLRADDIKTVVNYQHELPKISMDYRKMEQVILNLISNARAAMAGQENKVLRITTDWGDHRDQVRIIVADTGPGIQDDYVPKLFEAFFTTKEQGKGTGLGLYISQNIIRDHGGKIWAQNNESGGAAFCISLPLKRNGQKNRES